MIITYDGTSFEVDAVLGTAWLALRWHQRDRAVYRVLTDLIQATATEVVDTWHRKRESIPADRFDTLLRWAVHDAVQTHLYTRLCVHVRLLEVSELAADRELCAQIALGLGTLARRLQAESQDEDPRRQVMRAWVVDFVGLWRGHHVFDRVCEIAGWQVHPPEVAREPRGPGRRALTGGPAHRRERRPTGSHRMARRGPILCLPPASGV